MDKQSERDRGMIDDDNGGRHDDDAAAAADDDDDVQRGTGGAPRSSAQNSSAAAFSACGACGSRECAWSSHVSITAQTGQSLSTTSALGSCRVGGTPLRVCGGGRAQWPSAGA